MDNATALAKFEQHLRRRFPDRSTPIHYKSDGRGFFQVCAKVWIGITREDVDAFVQYGLEQGWKASTVQRRLAALKAFFDFCADETNQPDRRNPVELARHAPRCGERLPRDVSDETLQRLWLALEQPRDQVWFTLMLRAGLRVGEVVSLKREDILSAASDTTPARLRVLGKGRKERIVLLSADGYAVLARWLDELPAAPDTPVCPNHEGQAMTVNGLQERVRHSAAVAGVQVTAHQLRHTYARQMVEHDLPVTTLSKLMGHARLSTTQVYLVGADPQVRREYTEAMSRWEHALALPPSQSPAPTEVSPPTEPVKPLSPSAAPAKPSREPDLGMPAEPALPPSAPTEADAAAKPVPAPTPAAPALEPPRLTFEDWATDLPGWVRETSLAYIQRCQADWKPSQRRRHSLRRLQELALFWRWQQAHRPLTAWKELSRADLQAFLDQRLAEHRAPSTVTNELYAVWGALRLREEQGEVIAPSVYRIDLPKDADLAPRHLSEAEASRLEQQGLTVLKDDSLAARRDAACYFVLAHTGLRLSELLDLRCGDVDLTGARLRVVEGKGRRDRVVYLSPVAVQALERHLAGRPAQPPDAPLLIHPSGQAVSYRWVQRCIQSLGEAAGVSGVSPHRLRHTLATRLLNQGVPITTIQKLLGHRDLGTTQRYAHVADPTVERDYQRAMARIEPALSLAPLPVSAVTGPHQAEPPLAVPVVTKVPLDNSL